MSPPLTVRTDYTKASSEQKERWTTFNGDKILTPFVKVFQKTADDMDWGGPDEFANAVDVPCWGAAEPDDKYAMTMKYIWAFDETGGGTYSRFLKRAKRRSSSYVIGTFKTKREYETHPIMNGFLPFYFNVFVWDRQGNLIDGVY